MKNNNIKYFVLDVDGVLTTGHFLYSEYGKTYKIFGPHDADGLKMLKELVSIHFITADKRGYSISHKRVVDDMGYELTLVSELERHEYVKARFGFASTIYMGDGYFDAPIIKACAYGIAPGNARKEAKEAADYVTESNSGEGAVMDACLHIRSKYFDQE